MLLRAGTLCREGLGVLTDSNLCASEPATTKWTFQVSWHNKNAIHEPKSYFSPSFRGARLMRSSTEAKIDGKIYCKVRIAP